MNTTIGVDLGGTKLLMVFGEKRVRVATGECFSAANVEQNIRDFIKGLNDTPKAIGIVIPGLVDRTENFALAGLHINESENGGCRCCPRGTANCIVFV